MFVRHCAGDCVQPLSYLMLKFFGACLNLSLLWRTQSSENHNLFYAWYFCEGDISVITIFRDYFSCSCFAMQCNFILFHSCHSDCQSLLFMLNLSSTAMWCVCVEWLNMNLWNKSQITCFHSKPFHQPASQLFVNRSMLLWFIYKQVRVRVLRHSSRRAAVGKMCSTDKWRWQNNRSRLMIDQIFIWCNSDRGWTRL